jgi:hypothetical protein
MQNAPFVTAFATARFAICEEKRFRAQCLAVFAQFPIGMILAGKHPHNRKGAR